MFLSHHKVTAQLNEELSELFGGGALGFWETIQSDIKLGVCTVKDVCMITEKSFNTFFRKVLLVT